MMTKISTLLVPPLPPAHQKLAEMVAEHARDVAWEQLERERAAAGTEDKEPNGEKPDTHGPSTQGD